MLREYYSYEEITWIPIRSLMGKIDEFKPRLQEIAKRQEQERLKAELEGKRRQQQQQMQQRRGSKRY